MKNSVLILLIIFSSNLIAQKFRFSYDLGYGDYSLKNLKEFQLDYAKQINDLPIRTLIQFPNYLNHSISVCLFLDENNLFGINSAYLTTGARNSIVDYSGEYKLDMILNGYQFGLESEHKSKLTSNFDIHYNFKLGLIKSELKTTESLKIIGIDESYKVDRFSQLSFYLEPNMSISKIIFTGVAIKMGLGYNFNTSSLYNGAISWTGLRPRLGLFYSF